MEALLTVEQAAKRLHTAPDTVRRHLRAGRLRGIKLGRNWCVPESALTEIATNWAPAVFDEGNPLAQALALVEVRDRAVGKASQRAYGVDDVTTELRGLREARTA